MFNGGMGTLVVAPGAVDTEFYQSNNAGQIAVSYFGSDGIYHAAVYNSSESSWTNLPDVPGYVENLAGGINNHGVVLGDPFINSSYHGRCGMDLEREQLLVLQRTRIGPHEAGDSDLQHQRRRTDRGLFPG